MVQQMDRVSRSQEAVFVFVQCGDTEYIERLPYSLNALTRFSRHRVVVVTDTARNRIPINAPEIIDVRTPSHYTNQEAIIYLKTSVHRFVPEGPLYCYLDTDVVAVSNETASIFSLFQPPIIFAPDRLTVSDVSPNTVHCGCIERHEHELDELKRLLSYLARKERAEKAAAAAPRPPTPTLFQRALTKLGLQKPEPLIEVEIVPKEDWSHWVWENEKQTWITPTGRDIHHLECTHLICTTQDKFGVGITDSNWQLWNSGVFMFDARSTEFLDTWHKRATEAIADPYWKSLDWGALIVTIWESGMQNAATLPPRFNCLLGGDEYNYGAQFMEYVNASEPDGPTDATMLPVLCHVFNRYGDAEWDVWRWIEVKVRSKPLPRR